jgi:hypothetical protein
MLAAHERKTEVTLTMLEKSVDSLVKQMRLEGDFLTQRKPMGLGSTSNNNRRPPRQGLEDFD